MGKSASGKDTIYEHLLKEASLGLKQVVPYTTRPQREGERDGVEYYFRAVSDFERAQKNGKIIEYRCYQTVYGPWYYYTEDDGQFDPKVSDYLVIGTLESYLAMREYYGSDLVEPLYVDVEDGDRLMRAIHREQKQEKPKYEEMCRRFLADSKDFSEENLQNAGIKKRFENRELDSCMQEIAAYIKACSRDNE